MNTWQWIGLTLVIMVVGSLLTLGEMLVVAQIFLCAAIITYIYHKVRTQQ